HPGVAAEATSARILAATQLPNRFPVAASNAHIPHVRLPLSGDGARMTGTAARIEDHAMLGNCRSAALVDRDGTIDWLCLPRFDSDAVFAALLGNEEHGCWKLAPKAPYRSTRQYRDGSLVLETTFDTDTGSVQLLDFMVTSHEEE